MEYKSDSCDKQGKIFHPLAQMIDKNQVEICDCFGGKWPKKLHPPIGCTSFRDKYEIFICLLRVPYNEQIEIYEKLGELIIYRRMRNEKNAEKEIAKQNQPDWNWIQKFQWDF